MSDGTREFQDGFEGGTLNSALWADANNARLTFDGTAARGEGYVRLTSEPSAGASLTVVQLDGIGLNTFWEVYARFFFRIHQRPSHTVEAATVAAGAAHQAHARLMINPDGTWYVTVGVDTWGAFPSPPYESPQVWYLHDTAAGEVRTPDQPALEVDRWYLVTICQRYRRHDPGHGYNLLHLPDGSVMNLHEEATITIGNTTVGPIFREQQPGETIPQYLPGLHLGLHWEDHAGATYAFDYDGVAYAAGWGASPAPALPVDACPPLGPYDHQGSILCPPSRNFALGATIEVSGASVLTHYPASNAVDGALDTVLRLSASTGVITLDLGAAHVVNFVALLNHNVDPGLRVNLRAGGYEGSEAVLGVSCLMTGKDTLIDLRGLALTAARYWQLEFFDANSRHMAIGEIVIGNGYELDKVLSGVTEQERYWMAGGVTEQQVRSIVHSGTMSRAVTLDLVLSPADADLFASVFDEVGVSGGRVFLAPDSLSGQLYLLDWTAVHEATVPNAREVHLTLELSEQNTGVLP